MFDVGFWEIALIFGLGLLVLGPEKLPRIAAQLGRWVGRARRTASQLRWQLEREIDMDDQKRRYTPPPKGSQVMPPPGKQPSKRTGAADADTEAPPPPADESSTPPADQASAAPTTDAKRDPGDAA